MLEVKVDLEEQLLVELQDTTEAVQVAGGLVDAVAAVVVVRRTFVKAAQHLATELLLVQVVAAQALIILQAMLVVMVAD
jgi:hypothetical protein